MRSPTLDMIATNSLARALYSVLYTDARTAPNVARFTFLDPRARQFWPDWDQVADDLTAHLRAAAEPRWTAPCTELVGELSTRSDTFRELWARHDVRAHARGVKRFRHPVVGALDLRYDHLQLAARTRPDDDHLHRRTGNGLPRQPLPPRVLGGQPGRSSRGRQSAILTRDTAIGPSVVPAPLSQSLRDAMRPALNRVALLRPWCASRLIE